MTKTSQYTTHNRLAQLSRCFSNVLLGFGLVACHSNTTTATRDMPASVPVSYTHLTLPTNREV